MADTGGQHSPAGSAGEPPSRGPRHCREQAAPPRSGDVVAGVRLLSLLGRGGQGQVWSGTDVSDGADVAVKLLDEAASDLEGRLLHGVRHPHVLAVRRICHEPRAVVTELAEGGSLAGQVRARGVLPAEEVVTVLAPLAATLAHLHGRAVVHGDVTADNVLFVGRGRPVLSDLGGAYLAGSGVAVATDGYVAPVVRVGGPPTAASDVHGLAAVAWLALTGAVPPDAADRLPLRLLAPGCPDALVDLVTSALDPDPAMRPDPVTMAEVARASCRGVPVRLVPAASGVDAGHAVTYRVAEHPPGHPTGSSGRWWRRRGGAGSRSRRFRMAPLVTACLLVVAVGVAAAGASGAGWLQGATDSADPARLAAGSTPAPVATAPVQQAASPGGTDELVTQVEALVALREAVLRTGEASRLGQVHHPAGTTLASDRELLAEGPVPVTYDVLRVERVLPGGDVLGSGDGDGSPVVARVRLRTTGGAAGSSQGQVVEDVLLRLEEHDGELLLSSVSRA